MLGVFIMTVKMCSREIAAVIILLVSLKSTSKIISTVIPMVTFNFTCKIAFAATIEFEVKY